MFGLKENLSTGKLGGKIEDSVLSNKNMTNPNSKNEISCSTNISISDEEVKRLDEEYSSWGDTVHYSADPKVFRECDGSFMYDSSRISFLRVLTTLAILSTSKPSAFIFSIIV